jgi:hypothetical protein
MKTSVIDKHTKAEGLDDPCVRDASEVAQAVGADWTSPQPADTNGLLTVHPDGGLAL